MSKVKSQSGLATIKRDWSANFNDGPKSSQDSEIEWLPTPPQRAPLPPSSSSTSASTELTGREKRLRDIQNALSSRSTPVLAPVPPLAKRLSDTEYPDASDPPTKKSRKLPPGYGGDDHYDPMTRPTPFGSSARTTQAKTKGTSTAAPSSKRKGPISLSQEQTQILRLVEDGSSVFYTGSAGTGKSVLLREIIKSLRKKHSRATDAVAITASTGIAACNIGGVTIHSFAGIGLGIESAENLVAKIRKNKKAHTRWQRTKVLIIDEVSMLEGDLFDKLSRIGSLLRKSMEPFGGIQLIVTGDFFQLPPVAKSAVKFAFEATLWKEAIPRTFNLTQVFRQRDQEFVDMLNEMRFGRLTQKSINKFRSLSRSIEYDDGLGPTELFPRREDVDRSNYTRMDRLDTHPTTFEAADSGTVQDLMQRERLLSNFMAVKSLTLREGAQVMLIKNMDEQLVNGSMGRVLRFVDPTRPEESEFEVLGAVPGQAKKTPAASTGKMYPLVEFSLANGSKIPLIVKPEAFKIELPSGEVQASRSQLPLILAWAMSIHKSQGQTLDRVKVDLGKVFEKGQAYVALSRATSLDGLQVLNFDPSKVQAHPKVVEWSKTLETMAQS